MLITSRYSFRSLRRLRSARARRTTFDINTIELFTRCQSFPHWRRRHDFLDWGWGRHGLANWLAHYFLLLFALLLEFRRRQIGLGFGGFFLLGRRRAWKLLLGVVGLVCLLHLLMPGWNWLGRWRNFRPGLLVLFCFVSLHLLLLHRLHCWRRNFLF